MEKAIYAPPIYPVFAVRAIYQNPFACGRRILVVRASSIISVESSFLWTVRGFLGNGARDFDLPDSRKPVAKPMTEETDPALDADLSLMTQIKAGDREAFTRFYELHSGALFGLISSILKDSREAEDVLQEAFVYLWNHAAAYDPLRSKPMGWAIMIFRHKAIDRLRARMRQQKLVEKAAAEPMPDFSSDVAADENAITDERGEIVRGVLAEMPEDQRQAIHFAFFRGLSQTQISESLGVPLGTVKARIRRGLMKLRQSLKGKL